MRTVHWTGIHCSTPAVFKCMVVTPRGSVPSTAELLVGAAFSGRLSKCFGPISGLHTKLFYNIKSNYFFLPWRTFVVLTGELLWVKWLWFFQLILFANTAAFFCSLLGLASNSFWEGSSGNEISTRWLCVKKINHSRDVCFVLKTMAHKTTFLTALF